MTKEVIDVQISLCMIVKNEEESLVRCLESVKDIVSEMIIVDTGSTDSTVEIAEKYGAKVFLYDWDESFSNARNFSLSKASMDWILIMDADDEFEKADTHKLLNLVRNKYSNVNVYFMETLSYVGEVPDSNVIMNLNVRLIRNGKGYKFEGDIHEQIKAGPEDENKPEAIKVESIRIYHYGYLNKTVQAKNKRNRNMSIIQKELDKDPDNFFMLFNMGTEYYAMSNFTEALNYYKKSYEHFEPQLISSAKLILRMVSCYEVLGKTSEEFELIDEGLKYYPNFTDLEFKRACGLYNKKKYYLALDSLYKCLKMGEPPSSLNDLIGVGTFRPYYILANIFFEMGDYDEALGCCDKSLSINPKFTEALSKMSQIMLVKEIPVTDMKSKLESYYKPNFDESSYFILADIFYDLNKFDITKEYVEQAEKISKDRNKINYYKGGCLFFKKLFYEAYECFVNVSRGEFYERSIYYCILCQIFDFTIPYSELILNKNEDIISKEGYKTYKALMDIMRDKVCNPLSENKESSIKYIEPIFNILGIILKLGYFDEFQKALQLLNLIENDEVLLHLAKLYYKNGFLKSAYDEFIRSIKTFEKIDVEGLEMMKRILQRG